MILYFFLALLFLHDGVVRYKNTKENLSNFTRIEQTKVKKFHYYTQYGTYGFRVLFMPSPISIFFSHSGVFPNLEGNIDVGERLNLYSSFKGENLFASEPGGYLDFAGLTILAGSLIFLFYGYDTLRWKEYIALISSFAGIRKTYLYLFYIRFLLLILFFTAVTISGILFVNIEGVPLGGSELLKLAYFQGVFSLVSLFFFSIGAALGNIKDKPLAITCIIMIWIFSLYLVPVVINKILSGSIETMTTEYELELKKLVLLMDFDTNIIRADGKNTLGKVYRPVISDMLRDFMSKGYKKILELEQKFERTMKNKIALYRDLAICYPTGFFNSTSKELSSRGYESVTSFYRHTRELKEKFSEFYLEKKIQSDKGEIESFIKNGENVFYGKTDIPPMNLWGIAVTILYIFGVLWICVYFNRRSYVDIPAKELRKLSETRFDFNRGEMRILYTEIENFTLILSKLFSGQGNSLKKKGFSGKINWTGSNLTEFPYMDQYTYICPALAIPTEITAGDFLFFIAGLSGIPNAERDQIINSSPINNVTKKKFKSLQTFEKAEVLLLVSQFKNCPVYLFHNTAFGLASGFASRFKHYMETLSKKGAFVLYITTDDYVRKEKRSREISGVTESLYWSRVVDQMKLGEQQTTIE